MAHYSPGIDEYATYTVYAIEDPRYHEVRFVGYTDDIYNGPKISDSGIR